MDLGFDFWYTAILMIAMTVLLVTERIEVEITLFSTLALLIVGDVITLEQAFQGFSNVGMLTIAMLFVLAGALNNTGMLRQASQAVFGRERTSTSRKLLRILFPVSAMSAFVNNTPVVALLIPAIRSWAERHDYALSSFLMPLSFAAILGGMCTLIGTSTNLIVHGLMIEHGLEGMGLFEISKVGIPLTVLGVLFVSLVGHRILPQRRDPIIEMGEKTRDFVIELKVTEEYAHIGSTIEDAGLRHLTGLFLFQIERSGRIIAPAQPDEKILLGDRLFFTGIPKTILELQKLPGLRLTEDTHFDLKHYDSAEIRPFECVVSAASPLVGKTVRDSNFRSEYEAVIIAIHRHGERLRRKVGDVIIRPGDTLLVLAGRTFYRKWYHSNDFYLVAGSEPPPSKPQWRGWLTVGGFVAMMALTVSGVMPLLSAAALVLVLLLVTRTMRVNEVRNAINWRVLVVIALTLGIAKAVEESGVAMVLAEGIVQVGSHFGVMGVLTAVFVITSVYTLIITNNAAAAILFPIAYSAALAVGADPRAFAMAVAIAAAASFATPISYQTNLMVYGPGGYRFSDFLKLGIPLQVLTTVVALGLIWYFYL